MLVSKTIQKRFSESGLIVSFMILFFVEPTYVYNYTVWHLIYSQRQPAIPAWLQNSWGPGNNVIGVLHLLGGNRGASYVDKENNHHPVPEL
jgi:hypothetical protein